MNCAGCPYSYESSLQGIEIPQKPSNVLYCKLGFPIECQEGRLPRELRESIDSSN